MGFWLILAIVIALQVVAYLLMPKPKAPKPAAAQDLQTPTCEAGRPIPVAFGELVIKSPNVTWYGRVGTKRFEIKA